MVDISPADDDVRDFTKKTKPVRFQIDRDDGSPEFFEGIKALPAMLLVEFAVTMDSLSETDTAQQPKVFRDLFGLILSDESAKRFIERMSSKTDAIDMSQIMEVMPYLMEQYGMRPTQPSPVSSDGSLSPVDGKSLTGAISPLTSVPSTPIDS